MVANDNSALDALAILVQAIGRDKKLLQWFDGLAEKALVERRNEIYAMTDQMTKDRKDTNLIYSLGLLANPETFNAVRKTLHEHGYIND
jgi:hypothetical protein